MKNKKLLLYLSIILFAFYILPLFMKDTGLAMLILLIVLPITCLICSFLYGYIHAFQIMFPILVIGLFIPSVYMYYNSSALIYAFIYGGISFIGICAGYYASKSK